MNEVKANDEEYYSVGLNPPSNILPELKAKSGKFKGFGLVRDADGNPLIDDPENCPQEIKDLLTDEEYLTIYKQQRK